MKSRLLVLSSILLLAIFLRFFSLSHTPNGFYWDEIDVGFQARSLLETGRDYFGNPLPLFLHSMADYRAPVLLYSAVLPSKLFGFTVFSTRLVPVIWGILGIAAAYVLGQSFRKSGLIFSFVMAVSVWHLQYSRVAQEPVAMITCLLIAAAAWQKSRQKPIWFTISLVFFGLSLLAYSTAKLFVPLWLVVLAIWCRPKKISRLGIFAFFLIAIPVGLDSLFGHSGMRFHDLAVYTNPVVPTEIDQKRLETQIGLKNQRTVGISPSLADKFAYNKPEEWVSTISKNYLSAFSSDFLFIKGDVQLRHSPSSNSIGMLFAIESIALIIGLFATRQLSKPQKIFLLSWILLAPLPASLTRDGFAHAGRLMILMPALLLLVGLGLKSLANYKFFRTVFWLIYIATIANTYYFYFSRYRLESAIPFQYAHIQAANAAIAKTVESDQVILDMADDSGLMAYIFASHVTPAQFQANLPLKYVEITPDIRGYAFGKLVVLEPGKRNWTDQKFKTKTYIVASAKEPLLDTYQPKPDQINYPDGTPAFYLFSSK